MNRFKLCFHVQRFQLELARPYVPGFALNSKKLKDKLMDTSQLINEINIEYARTMNKIVFDDMLVLPTVGAGSAAGSVTTVPGGLTTVPGA